MLYMLKSLQFPFAADSNQHLQRTNSFISQSWQAAEHQEVQFFYSMNKRIQYRTLLKRTILWAYDWYNISVRVYTCTLDWHLWRPRHWKLRLWRLSFDAAFVTRKSLPQLHSRPWAFCPYFWDATTTNKECNWKCAPPPPPESLKLIFMLPWIERAI